MSFVRNAHGALDVPHRRNEKLNPTTQETLERAFSPMKQEDDANDFAVELLNRDAP